MVPSDVLKGLVGGAQSNTSAGAALGILGVIIGGIILAGLGLKFSAVLIAFSQGNLFIALCLVTLVSIIIGMGYSPLGQYIILPVVAGASLTHTAAPPVAPLTAG